MDNNPYRAPPSAGTLLADGRAVVSPRRIASLSAGFCVALATVFGMVAVVAALVSIADTSSWLSWSPVIAIGATLNVITSIIAASAIWKARWVVAIAAVVLGVLLAILLLFTWYTMFEW